MGQWLALVNIIALCATVADAAAAATLSIEVLNYSVQSTQFVWLHRVMLVFNFYCVVLSYKANNK